MSGLKLIFESPIFRMRYNPRNVPEPISQRLLGQFRNPIYPKIKHMTETRDKDCLWWSVGVLTMLDERRVVRSWCARRLRVAFRESLRRNGLDENGRRIREDATSTNTSTSSGGGSSTKGGGGGGTPTPTVNSQRGTMILEVYPQMKKTSFEEVQRTADQAMIRLQRRMRGSSRSP